MGEVTGISWCHHTWSPWGGCWKISPGCKHCYAAALDTWLHKGEHWERTGPRQFYSEAHWAKPVRWNRAAERVGERRRVFPSVCDPFEDRPDLSPWRMRMWRLIRATPHLDWLLLTKRAEEMESLLPWTAGQDYGGQLRDGAYARGLVNMLGKEATETPWPNVWPGVTVEDGAYAWRRLRVSLRLPAAVHWASYEPALGPINFRALRESPTELGSWDTFVHSGSTWPLRWIVAGDESGRERRPAEVAWFRDVRDQCASAGVRFHFKQWAGEDTAGIEGQRAGKRGDGKIHLPILDGAQHAAFPEMTDHAR